MNLFKNWQLVFNSSRSNLFLFDSTWKRLSSWAAFSNLPYCTDLDNKSLGYMAWYNKNTYHKTDGPALIMLDGTTYYFRYGKLHREDGPAIVFPDGTKEWHLEGRLCKKVYRDGWIWRARGE